MPGEIGGNRPGGRPGVGNGNRPGGWPGLGGGNRPNWPGFGNRPGNRPGFGNSGQIGDNNLGIANRPNYGGNTIINNNNNWNNINWNNNNWGGGGWGGGWGGGGWGGGGRWGGGWATPGWGGGWSRPFYGDWYRGGWGTGSFWAGFGTGAATAFGLGALGNVLAGPTYVSYPAFASYGLYDYFPSWGVNNYASWGLGSVASSYLYSDYSNPYYETGAAAVPAVTNTTVAYDYSQPINVAATPPEPTVAESTEQVFSAARDAFKAGNYPSALELTDQVLKLTPNVPVVHEFRGLTLFAQKRYDEAAAVDYAVLSAGPGWNWSTLIGLYPGVEVYTDQIRALEASVRENPGSTAGHFLLGYHYMVQGHGEQAATQFEKVVALQPKDELSASFVMALKKVSDAAAVASSTPPAGDPNAPPARGEAADPADAPASPEDAPPPPPPPTRLLGIWKAQPSRDVVIDLALKEDGVFTWVVDTKGEKQTISGQAGFKDGVLALLQPDGPPLAGKVTEDGPDRFKFRPPGASDSATGLTFNRGT